jgi:hypothetical protein
MEERVYKEEHRMDIGAEFNVNRENWRSRIAHLMMTMPQDPEEESATMTVYDDVEVNSADYEDIDELENRRDFHTMTEEDDTLNHLSALSESECT